MIGTVVAAGTLRLITLHQAFRASDHEFLTLLAITEGLTVFGLLIGFWKSSPRVRPVKEWINGGRDPANALEAWDAAVNLPMRVFRDDLPVAVVVAGIPSVVAVMVVLDQPWTAFFPLAVISAVAVVYAMVLQYFGMETGMRPVVDEIVAELPTEFEFKRVGLSLTA